MAGTAKILVVLAWLTSSCSSVETNEPAAPSHGGEPRAESSTPPVASLSADVAAAYQELEREYLEIATEEFAQALSRAREEWNGRIDRCPDEACRIGLLQDQLNRIRYAFGHNDRPVQGLRWRGGHFSFNEGGAAGSMTILPVADDRLLVIGDAMQMPDGRWLCQLYAEGQIDSNGVAEIATLDELHQRYRLEPLSPRQLRVILLSEGTDRMCGLNGTLEGEYRVTALPREPRTSRH
jgi:hypothetical protein